jgi:hypothetical protein
MQRLSLHFRGVKVPTLGSLQDRVFRRGVHQERLVEAKRAEFLMLITSSNPQFSDAAKHREWGQMSREVWKEYVGLLTNTEMSSKSAEDEKLLEYYERVVKHVKPSARMDKNGTIIVTGIDALKT